MIFTYVVMAIIVFGMNIIPAFMPATWIILAYFYITHHLELVPTVIIGAIAAMSGRCILWLIAKNVLKGLLSEKRRRNFEAMGKVLVHHKNLTIPLILTYAFLPIPSNQVFIAVGLAEIAITPIALSFFMGRLVSYSFWLQVTQRLNDNLEGLFSKHFSNSSALIIEGISLGLLLIVSLIPWEKILKKLKTVEK